MDAAIEQAQRCIAEGAHLLDIGGESTRPGSQAVPDEEQWRRVGPVIEALAARTEVPSRSTPRARPWPDGPSMRAPPGSTTSAPAPSIRTCCPLVAQREATYVAMHCTARPDRMQQEVHLGDPTADVSAWLRARLAAAVEAGIDPGRCLLDPGIGFGKHLAHNLDLLRRLWEFRSLGCPLLLGVSRKSFIAHLDQAESNPGTPVPDPDERLGGTAAAVSACVAGGAAVLRVHDIATMAQAARMAYALHHPTAHSPPDLAPSPLPCPS
ncbi:MAG: dihydropteroate synthase [Planctomycetota bacterium]